MRAFWESPPVMHHLRLVDDGTLPALQADLNGLRNVINSLIDVINAQTAMLAALGEVLEGLK